MESPLKNINIPSVMLPTVEASGGQGGNFTLPIYGGIGASVPDQLTPVTAPAYNAVPDGDVGAGSAFGQNFSANLQSPQAIAGIASGVGGIFQGLIGRKKRRREQQAAQEKYDQMMSQYQQLDTSNLYADVENQFRNMENTMEDLTINQQQAQFEAQQGMQQRADIMANLRGAAGGSGIAGLAQALANQGQLATQRASASIGMQESRNQMAAAQQAAKLQMAERVGEAKAEQLRLSGAERARGLEYQKTSTQLGMSQQELAARNQAIAQANAALYGGIAYCWVRFFLSS